MCKYRIKDTLRVLSFGIYCLLLLSIIIYTLVNIEQQVSVSVPCLYMCSSDVPSLHGGERPGRETRRIFALFQKTFIGLPGLVNIQKNDGKIHHFIAG